MPQRMLISAIDLLRALCYNLFADSGNQLKFPYTACCGIYCARAALFAFAISFSFNGGRCISFITFVNT